MAKKKKVDAMLEMFGTAAEVAASNSDLSQVSELAKAQHEAMLRVAECEDSLQTAKAALRKIAEVDLPEAMRECGVKEFVTADGLEVKTKDEVQASIAVANREEAYTWLIEHKFGGLLKLSLGVSFERGEQKKAEKLAEQLRKKGMVIDLNQSIHAQTLKSFVKERIADTEAKYEFPLKLFGAHPYTVAVVKPKK